MSWKAGDRITHRFNPELGPGIVTGVEGRMLTVRFPASDTTLRLAADSDAVQPLVLRAGSRARLLPEGETVSVESVSGSGRARLADGREVELDRLWPLDLRGSLIERLAHGEVDPVDEFALRLDTLRLAAIREADGLGSFLGGRIHLFPHQLYVAERATRSDPVRWLLADEVGLGKTVESCLILNHLLRTGRADSALVVAPATLTVQWLGELWRKYHQVFVLLDEQRLTDVEKEFGKGFNPFDAHRRVVIALELLRERPWLTRQAAAAGIDLLIIDEAHHLRRPPGHPGDPSYRAVEPVAALGRHVLLLTATPLEEDAHGFFRLLQLLRPDELTEDRDFEARLERGTPLPACTSCTRRVDIGGLPPRVGVPVDLDDDTGWGDLAALEARVRSEAADNPVTRRAKARRIRRALASGTAVAALMDRRDESFHELARRADENDPRVRWLVAQGRRWRERSDKTLIFVAHRETLELIKTALGRQAQLRVGVFHEDLSAGQRDIEVAQFRLPGGPSILISTECGGEGRNFEFCTRLVLFDLPWNPMLVEQRIGRLDRIGRRIPVEIVHFRPPSGVGRAVARLYESLGLYQEPLGGLERELAEVEGAIEQAALSADTELDPSEFERLVDEARRAHDRVRRAAYRELHREPYRAELARGILERVPEELDELNEQVLLAAAEQLGLHVEQHRGRSRYSIELGHRARVETLPGVPAGSSFLGTFDRDEAVREENMDFFASGHPLVEGILAHLEESPLGRVALLHVTEAGGTEGFGLLAIYRRGSGFEAVALDAEGRERPEWAALLTRSTLRTRRVQPEAWAGQPGWTVLIRSLGRRLEARGAPFALAAFRIGA